MACTLITQAQGARKKWSLSGDTVPTAFAQQNMGFSRAPPLDIFVCLEREFAERYSWLPQGQQFGCKIRTAV